MNSNKTAKDNKNNKQWEFFFNICFYLLRLPCGDPAEI